MRRIFKKTVAIIICLCLTACYLPVGAIAANNSVNTDIDNNMSMSSTDSFGDLLTDTIDTDALDADAPYFISDLIFNGNNATASYYNELDCSLVVAVYDEATEQMLDSEVIAVEAESLEATVSFDSLPDNFIAKAFLLDDGNSSLCKPYVCNENTAEYEEFIGKTVEDFDEEKVIRLEESTKNNFVVLSEETLTVSGSDSVNNLEDSDIQNSRYTFSNIDEQIKTLNVGDAFYFDNGDSGSITVIKVASISINGDTAVIIADEASFGDFFEYIKIDTSAGTEDAEYDGSSADESVTYLGEADYETGELITPPEPGLQTAAEFDGDAYIAKSKKFELYKDDKYSATIDLKLSLKLKIHIGDDYSEVSLTVEPSAKITLENKDKLPLFSLPLGKFTIRPILGVTIHMSPVFKAEFTGKLTVSGEFTFALGLGWKSGSGIVNKCKKPSFKPQVNVEVTFFIGFDFKPELTVVHENIASASMTATVGAEIKAKLSSDNGDEHLCKACIDGDINGVFKVTGKISIAKTTKFGGDWSATLINIKVKIIDFYYSFDYLKFGFGECPYDEAYVPGGGGEGSSGGTTGGGIGGEDSGENGDIIEVYYVYLHVDGMLYKEIPVIAGEVIPELDAPPAIEGFTFVGWYGYEYGMVMPEQSLSFYGVFEVNYYTVSWLVDGEVIETYMCSYGASFLPPDDPAKEGYYFSHWDGYTANMTMPAHDLTFEAYFTAGDVCYAVSTYIMDTNGNYGDPIEMEIKTGRPDTTASVAHVPMTGFTPDLDKSVLSGNIAANGSLVLKLYYSRVTFDAEFDANGGTWSDGDETKKVPTLYGTEINAPGAPQREGYTFYGWSDVEGRGFIAIWVINEYIIECISEGKLVEEFGAEYSVVFMPPADPVSENENYTFEEWVFYDGTPVSFPHMVPAHNLTIYACFLDSETGNRIWLTSTDTLETAAFENGAETVGFTYDKCIAGNTYTLLNVTDYGEGFKLSSDNLYFINTVSADENGKVTASFIPKSGIENGTILLVGDFGNGIEAVVIGDSYNEYKVSWVTDEKTETFCIKEGDEITIPQVPEKVGYSFAGWTPSVPPVMPSNDITFIATWSVNSYDAIFNANGGKWSDGDETKKLSTPYGDKISAPDAPAKQGYIFSCWSPEVGIMDDVNGKEFTAEWVNATDTRYTVETYIMNTVGEYEKSVSVFTAETDSSVNADYNIENGFALNNEKSVLSGTVAADNSLVLKVYIDRNVYTFTTIVDGKETKTAYYYGAIIADPVKPEKTGYEFIKWDKEIQKTMPANDFTVTAVFKSIVNVFIKNNPGSKTVNYGETLKLTAVTASMPSGAKIYWYVNGEKRGEGATFEVSPESGSVEVTVKIVDADGNVMKDADNNEISDSQRVSVNSGFWQKIVSFFKNLFGIDRTVVQ